MKKLLAMGLLVAAGMGSAYGVSSAVGYFLREHLPVDEIRPLPKLSL